MTRIWDRRFVIVTGKGGVGKTSVAAALALAAARRGLRVLVAMCNAKERLSALLGGPRVGDEIAPLTDGIEAVNLVPEKCLQEYGMMILKIRALYRAVFENRLVQGFLGAAPGLGEWAMLGKAWYHTTEQRNGEPRYHLVVLDAPSTGHGVDLLRVPKVLVDVAPPGPLRSEAEKAWSLMRDPRRCETLLVTVPEEMPVSEAMDLHGILGGDLGLPLFRIVVNEVLPDVFAEEEEKAILSAKPAPEVATLVESARSRAVRSRLQRHQLARLSEAIPLPQVRLPYTYGPEFGRTAIEALSAELAKL